ncbi:MAG: hypothetical protein GY740_25625 [Gammaproteobacteria bacterium]|nr:hypothetical protein [Gammaproteobacteria bacterium]
MFILAFSHSPTFFSMSYGFHSLYSTENFPSPPAVTKPTPKPEETFDREKEIEESREASKRVSRLIGGASAVKRRAPPKKKKAPAKKPKKVEKSEGVEAILEGLRAILKERKRKKKKEK